MARRERLSGTEGEVTKGQTLLDADPTGAVSGVSDAALEPAPDALAMFERLARDPAVDPDKLAKLIDQQERIMRFNARVAFNQAMNAAQKDIKAVVADAYNPSTSSKYASYQKLDDAVRPVYVRHGFALSFDTGETSQPDHVLMLCDVTHIGGHEKQYRLDMPADGKGAKGGDVMTKTHATGSATQYGMRYLLKMIFNIPIDRDDDGNKASAKDEPPPPEGYDAWLATLDGVADSGMADFSKAWNASKKDYRDYLARTAPKMLASIKTKAAKVKP